MHTNEKFNYHTMLIYHTVKDPIYDGKNPKNSVTKHKFKVLHYISWLFNDDKGNKFITEFCMSYFMLNKWRMRNKFFFFIRI